MKLIAIGVAGLCALTSLGASEVTEDDTSSPWHYQLYVDAGYAYTDNDPANHDWRSKSTTNKLNEPELFLGMGNVGKKPIPGSLDHWLQIEYQIRLVGSLIVVRFE